MIHQFVVAFLLLAGALLVLVASVGLLRMPDIYMRMQAGTKASSLGAGTGILGAAVYFATLDIVARALAIVLFIAISTPLAAHLIARGSHRTGIEQWRRTRSDALEQDRRRRED